MAAKRPAKGPAKAPTKAASAKPALPPNIRFVRGTYPKKYTAIFTRDGKTVKVSFGHQDYQQYMDQIPPSLGGGLYRGKDHLDPQRRANYRRRHGAQGYQSRPYSPAWFSYYYLW